MEAIVARKNGDIRDHGRLEVLGDLLSITLLVAGEGAGGLKPIMQPSCKIKQCRCFCIVVLLKT
jgi:hypothetical protein